jgi:hypothetical protein
MKSANFAALAAAMLAACTSSSDSPDNAAVFAAIQTGRSGGEVIAQGLVTLVFPSSLGPSGLHERFDIRIGSGVAEQDIAVADNITVGEPAPVHRGDSVIVKGVLELDPSGPVIHWTHHDPRFRHPSGFVEVGGKKYE